MAKKTVTIVIDAKEPDVFGELIDQLGLSQAKADRFFSFGEYASIELEVDKDMNIVSGRFLSL